MAKENEIVLFETEDEKVKLSVPIQNETVWLTQDQMSELFDTARFSIAYLIGNIFKEKELERDTSVEIFDRSKNSSRPPQYYNLDVIISVGYRVKSRRGIEFRRWANKVLKDYIIKGYAINDKRLEALQKTVEIQAKMLATAIEGDSDEVLKAVNLYTQALTLLDKYDHQSLEKPEGKRHHDDYGHESFERGVKEFYIPEKRTMRNKKNDQRSHKGRYSRICRCY